MHFVGSAIIFGGGVGVKQGFNLTICGGGVKNRGALRILTPPEKCLARPCDSQYR